MTFAFPPAQLRSPMAGRRFVVAAAVSLAMVLVAVVGYRFVPKADVRLPLVADCALDRQPACVAELPGGRMEMAISPRPIPSNQPLNVSVSLSGIRADRVEIDFAGVDMNMGHIGVRLAAAGAGRYTGQATLPVCVTGRMAWWVTVLLDTGREVISVPFRFDSGQG